jgi:hypothetical protein
VVHLQESLTQTEIQRWRIDHHDTNNVTDPQQLTIMMESSSSNQQQQDLTTLFAQTISALSADAKALKQIVCLQEAASKDAKYEDALLDLEAGVTSVEDKVQALQHIAHDERQALDVMEEMYDESSEQNIMLKKLLQDVILKKQQGQQQQSRMKAQSKPTPAPTRQEVVHDDKENMVETLRRLNLESPVILATPQRKSRRQSSVDTPKSLTPSYHRQSMTSHQQQPMPLAGEIMELEASPGPIQMQLISSDELLAVARTIRGRITLSVLNDAVRDIERVCAEKYRILQGKALRQHYRKYWMLHRALEVEELHGDQPWVSEQDLRNACAFFRSGESTARSILAILRTLRRLKQVAGRNSQVTYIVVEA